MVDLLPLLLVSDCVVDFDGFEQDLSVYVDVVDCDDYDDNDYVFVVVYVKAKNFFRVFFF